MPGLWPIFRKELADQFSSRRFLIIFGLILVVGWGAIYIAAESIRADVGAAGETPRFIFLRLFTASSGSLPPFVIFIGLLGPIVGLALGFDAINGEHNRRTLSRLLAQPIFRDSVINGKFLAGLTTISLMLLGIVLLVAGLGVRLIGIGPTPEEVLRLLVFVVISIVYVAFWLSLSVLLSLLFRQMTTSALAGVALWILLTFFVSLLAGLVAQGIAPVSQDSDPLAIIHHEQLRQMLSRVSPAVLYQEATFAILTPNVRTLSLVVVRDSSSLIPRPLPLRQSLAIIWPHVGGLIALTAICFGIGYLYFQRQEIRAP